VLLCLAALAGCGEDDEAAAPAPPLADLRVSVDPDGRGSRPARTASVRCSAPSDSAACRAAAALTPDDLAPVRRGTVCTQIYGGPEVARITGTLRGERVDARFSRENGCEIARWEAVQPLLEAAT
jgi:hypothetical protein